MTCGHGRAGRRIVGEAEVEVRYAGVAVPSSFGRTFAD